MELTILMPCLNEARTIATCIQDAKHFLIAENIKGEILIADNGSTDGSIEIARKAGARVIEVHERGYGAALLGGIRSANGRYIIMGDADDSYDFLNLHKFVDELRAGSQLVMGNRFRGGIAEGAMPPLHRWLGNPVLSAIGRLFFHIPIGDFHCGLRGFNTKSVREIHLTGHGMEFATEMVAKASFAELKITEVPTTLRADGRDRAPHLRTWRDGWRHLRFMLLFSPLWLFLLPGLVLFFLGVLGLIGLSMGPRFIFDVGIDIHTMLFCGASAVLGVQAIQWGGFVYWIGISSGMRRAKFSPVLKKFARSFSIEIGLAMGAVIFCIGLGWSISLLADWVSSSLGQIHESSVMRGAIVASTLMIIGAQIAGGSMFAGALGASIQGGFSRLRASSK